MAEGVIKRREHESAALLMVGLAASGAVLSGIVALNIGDKSGQANAANKTPVSAYIAPSISISDLSSSSLCDGDSDSSHLCLKWNTANTGASGTQTFKVETNADGYTLYDDIQDKLTGVKNSANSVALTHSTASTAEKTAGTTSGGTISDTYKYSFIVTANEWATPADTYTQSFKYTATATIPAAPTITSISPTQYIVGSDSDTLTIKGSALTTTYDVYIASDSTTKDDSHRCTVTSATSDTVECSLPTGLAAGAYKIYLTSVGGSAESTGQITYIKKSICTNADPESECAVDIDAHMIPVKYVGDSVAPKWVVADKSVKGDWYNYGDKKWANAVTVKADKLSTYKAASAGTEVSNDDVLGYFVYIPRYAYEVQRRDATDKYVSDSGNSGFDIHFETTSTPKSTPAAGCSTLSGSTLTAKDYRTECGINRTYHGGTTTDGVYAATTWATHPAFTWGKLELNGFWIGKFETTGKISAPTIKPNQVANISNTIGQQFTSAASIGVDDPTADTMGSTVSNITKNGHNLLGATSHMLKNSEWGAAAYLSASSYGAGVNNVKNNGITNSNSSTDADGDGAYAYGGAATGCGPSTATSDDSASQHSGIKLDAATIENDGVCETSSTDTTHAYNQSLGVLASTTNNVYGVYDMAGGMVEYAMGNRTTVAGQSTSDASYVANPIKVPYLDLYNTSDGFGTKPSWSSNLRQQYLYNNDVCTWITCGGHGLHETKRVQSVLVDDESWGNDDSGFPGSVSSWALRGGSAIDGSYAGLFSVSDSGGRSSGGFAFRVSLVPASQ